MVLLLPAGPLCSLRQLECARPASEAVVTTRRSLPGPLGIHPLREFFQARISNLCFVLPLAAMSSACQVRTSLFKLPLAVTKVCVSHPLLVLLTAMPSSQHVKRTLEHTVRSGRVSPASVRGGVYISADLTTPSTFCPSNLERYVPVLRFSSTEVILLTWLTFRQSSVLLVSWISLLTIFFFFNPSVPRTRLSSLSCGYSEKSKQQRSSVRTFPVVDLRCICDHLAHRVRLEILLGAVQHLAWSGTNCRMCSDCFKGVHRLLRKKRSKWEQYRHPTRYQPGGSAVCGTSDNATSVLGTAGMFSCVRTPPPSLRNPLTLFS